MALADLFRTRKANRLNRNTWAALWEQVKTPPDGDTATRERHAVFVGTLLYATRQQAALAAGMAEPLARTLALEAIAQANFDEALRDQILAGFSAGAGGQPQAYAAALTPLISALVAAAKTQGNVPQGGEVEGLLQQLSNLLALFPGESLSGDAVAP